MREVPSRGRCWQHMAEEAEHVGRNMSFVTYVAEESCQGVSADRRGG